MEIKVRSSVVRRVAAMVALTCALGVSAAGTGTAVENPSSRFYSADDTSDEYGGAGATWVGPPSYGPGPTGAPGDRAFALGGDAYLTVDDPSEGNFGILPFTLRFSARFAGPGGPSEQVLSKRPVCSQGTLLDVRTRNGRVFAELQDPANFLFGVQHPADVYDGAYHEVIVSRSGTTLSVTVDGSTVSGQTNGVVDLDNGTPMRFGEGPCVTRPGQVGDGTTRADVLLDDISYGLGPLPIERPLVPGLPVGAPPVLAPLVPDPAVSPGAGPEVGPDPGGDTDGSDTDTGSDTGSDTDPDAAGVPAPESEPTPGVGGETGVERAAVGPLDANAPLAAAAIADAVDAGALAGLGPAEAEEPQGAAEPAVGAALSISGSAVRDRGVAAVEFARALPSPTDVGWDLASIMRSVLLTLVLLALLALPVGVVNSTAEANADRIEAAVARLRVRVVAEWSARLPLTAAVTVSTVASAVLYGFLEPSFRFDESSAALVLGLAVAFVVVTVAQEVSQYLYVGRWVGIRGHLALFPGFLLLGLACVGLSRVMGLEPGLILGTLVAFGTTKALWPDQEGPALAISAASLTAVGLLAWFLRDPLVAAAGAEGSFLAEAIGAGLSAVMVASAENLAFALIPITFLDGATLFTWSKQVWAFFAALGGFAFVHVLLQPSADAGAFVGRGVFLTVLLSAYLLAAAAFWAWFRYRRPAPSPVDASVGARAGSGSSPG